MQVTCVEHHLVLDMATWVLNCLNNRRCELKKLYHVNPGYFCEHLLLVLDMSVTRQIIIRTILLVRLR